MPTRPVPDAFYEIPRTEVAGARAVGRPGSRDPAAARCARRRTAGQCAPHRLALPRAHVSTHGCAPRRSRASSVSGASTISTRLPETLPAATFFEPIAARRAGARAMIEVAAWRSSSAPASKASARASSPSRTSASLRPTARITALLGPNGAGKTTTMRVVAGLVHADSGHARVGGVDVAADPHAVRAQLGMLSDARGLYARLTARENVQYYADLRRVARSGARRTPRDDRRAARHGARCSTVASRAFPPASG